MKCTMKGRGQEADPPATVVEGSEPEASPVVATVVTGPEPEAYPAVAPASPDEASLEQALQMPARKPPSRILRPTHTVTAVAVAAPARKPGLEEQMQQLLWASNKVLLTADESQGIARKTRTLSEDLDAKLSTMEEEACELTLQSTEKASRRASVRSGGELRAANEEALKIAFTQFDTNGDGFLSEVELIAVLTRPTGNRKPMTDAAAAHLFRELDQNGDGQIDYAEFVQNWTRVVSKRAAAAAASEEVAQAAADQTTTPSCHSGV